MAVDRAQSFTPSNSQSENRTTFQKPNSRMSTHSKKLQTSPALNTLSNQFAPLRPIPPSPNSFYESVHQTSQSGIRFSGLPAPHGLGGDPLVIEKSNRNSYRNGKGKGITGGRDTTGQSNAPTTVEEAAKYLIGPVAPLINRQGVDHDEKLIEKAFMEATMKDVESKFQYDATHAPHKQNGRDFLRHPILWIREIIGFKDEESIGFKEIPFFYQPARGIEKNKTSPALYHGEETLDHRRKYRLERQAMDEVYEQTTKRRGEILLDKLINNNGSIGLTASKLRQTASNFSMEELKQEQMPLGGPFNKFFKLLFGVKRPLSILTNEHIDNQAERKLIGIFGGASVVLITAFTGLLVQQQFDLIGDSKPPSDY